MIYGILSVFSGVQLWAKKSSIHRNLLPVWLSIFVGLPVQLLLQQNDLAMVLGVSINVLMSISLAELGSFICKSPRYSKWMLWLFGISLPLSALFYSRGMSFTWVSFPPVVTLLLPLSYFVFTAIRDSWATLSFSKRGYVIASALLVIHHLDFIIFRKNPVVAPFGYMLAVALTLVLALFALSIVNEITDTPIFNPEALLRHPLVTVLSPREKEVLIELVTTSHSNTEIGAALFISVSTVKKHIGQIFNKTGAKSRQDLIWQLTQSVTEF